MLEKIPLLKDFIIYVIPGVLCCYFGLNIASFFMDYTDLRTETISNDSALSFIGIIFGFLIGFLISQLQIILFNALLYRYNKKLRTIAGTSLPEEIKQQVAKQVLKAFNLTDNTTETILKDHVILYMCLNYIKIHGNDESNFFINRSSNLSSFASVAPIPIMLGIWNLLLHLDFSNTTIIISLIVTSLLIGLLASKIASNFRQEWINSVYRQFLILSLKTKSSG